MVDLDMHILIVDDSPLLRKVHGDLLKSLGFKKITEADDGKPALEKMLVADSEGKPINLVLLDSNMPKIEGITVIKTMRKLPQLKMTPVIMVTADPDKETVIKLIQAGVNGYVVKPLTKESLLTNIEKILGGTKAPVKNVAPAKAASS